MIPPLSCNAVPFLWRGDDNIGLGNALCLVLLAIPSKLCAGQAELTESALPIALTLRTKGFGWSLVDNFEAVAGLFAIELADCELEDDGFTTPSRRREHKVVATMEDCLETFGLNGVEKLEGEAGSKSVG